MTGKQGSVAAPREEVTGAVIADATQAAAGKRDRSLIALVLLFVALSPLVTQRIYASDEIQYFAYTHSLVFDRDLDFSNEYLHFYNLDKVKFADIYRDLYSKHEPLTGLPINVAPVGTGLFWLPAYLLAHAVVLLARSLGANITADGYSQPYITAICYASYIYGCIGLLLCYFTARRLFGGLLAGISTATMWLATPVIFYTVIAPPWSHATSLMTVSLFIWYWQRTRSPEGRSLRQWLLLGLFAGAMMLVREQDALFLVVPFVEVAWLVIAALMQKRRAESTGPLLSHVLKRSVVGFVAMGVTAAVLFIPQLIAYRVITGRFSPSKVVSGKFTWTSPNFLNVLFSPEHGLIPWTPVFALAFVGLVFLWKRDRMMTLAFSAALLLQVYIAGSFLTWQSASSFGQRRFINSTSIFVVGFAALAAWLLANGMPKWALYAVSALFVAWNAGLLMQYALWCSPQRQGLDWATVIKGQIEMPGRAFGLLRDYLFDRQVFYRRTRGC